MTSDEPAASRTLLIVDDHRAFRAAARGLLGSSFRVVGEAGSGEEGVEMATRLLPDVVLMDVRLPDITGPEATRRIIALLPGTAVVLVSTQDRNAVEKDLAACGAVGFIRKDDLDVSTVSALVG